MSSDVMTGSANKVPGHSLFNEGAAFSVNGERIYGGGYRGGFGRAKCSCGALSDATHSSKERQAWHRAHKNEERMKISGTVIEAPMPHPYLTVIPDRSPLQKVHTDLAQARKAILYRVGGNADTLKVACKVYKWTARGWETLWDIPEGTDRKDMPWLATESPKN